MPASTTMGDYLRPSVFVKAARMERAAKSEIDICEALGIKASDEDDDLVKDFETKYTDVVRMQPKSKRAEAAASSSRAKCPLQILERHFDQASSSS